MNGQPKKCLARAIVSMGLGIFAVNLGSSALVYDAVMLALNLLFRNQREMPEAALWTFNVTYTVCVWIFVGSAVAAAIISLFQGKKFCTLYNCYDSRMQRAGKVLSIIALVICAVALLLLIPALMSQG